MDVIGVALLLVTGVVGDVVLSRESGSYGVDISKGVWHMVEGLVLGSLVIL